MSALFTVTLSDDNGNDVDIPVQMRTVLKWEQTYPGRSAAQLDEHNLKISHVYELAYLAAQKAGQFVGSFDDFADLYDVTPVEESKSEDPTQTAA